MLGQFPHQASLRTAANSHFCGGFIESNRWVISAAHCTYNRTISNTRIVVGTISLTSGGTTYTIQKILNHPSYSINTVANDISLVKTAAAITFNDNVKAIPLPPLVSLPTGPGVAATVSGWGQTSHPGSAPDILQYLNVTTITNANCRSRFDASQESKVFNNKICTLPLSQGQGACMGDSGGALVANGVAIGVVSWGVPCGTGAPDVYDRVLSHRVWITATQIVN